MDFDILDEPPPPTLPTLDLKINELSQLAINVMLRDIIVMVDEYQHDISADIKRLLRTDDKLTALLAVRVVSELARHKSHRVLYTGEDAIGSILTLLQCDLNSDTLLMYKHCCRALGNLCYDNNVGRHSFLSLNGVSIVKTALGQLLEKYNMYQRIPEVIVFPIKALMNFCLGGGEMAEAIQENGLIPMFEQLLNIELRKEVMDPDMINSILYILHEIMDHYNRHYFPLSMNKTILFILRESKSIEITDLCLEHLQKQIESEEVRSMIIENQGVHLLCDRLNIWLERNGIGQVADAFRGGYVPPAEDEQVSPPSPVNEQPLQENLVHGNVELEQPIQNMEVNEGVNDIQDAEISQNPDTPDNGEATPRSIPDGEGSPRRAMTPHRGSQDEVDVTQSGDVIPNPRRDDDDDDMDNNEALAVEIVDNIPVTRRSTLRRRMPIVSDEDSINGDNNEAIPARSNEFDDSSEDEVVMVPNAEQGEENEEPRAPSPIPIPVIAPEDQIKHRACDLLVTTLVGESAMPVLFQEGRGEIYRTMIRWMHSTDLGMVTTATLAIGNFARDDRHCIILMENGTFDMLFHYYRKYYYLQMDQRNHPEAFPNWNELNIVKVQHALLSCMRNMCVPHENKDKVANDGKTVKLLVEALPSVNDYNVAFKLLATLRMICLADDSVTVSHELVQNVPAVLAIARWGRAYEHPGPSGEAPRLLAWVIRRIEEDWARVRLLVPIEGCLSCLVNMLLSPHVTMQAEAIEAIAACAAATVNPDFMPDPDMPIHLEHSFLGQLVNTEIGKHLAILLGRNPRMILEVFLENIHLILSLTVIKPKVCRSYKEANLHETIYTLIEAKPDINENLKNNLRIVANTIEDFEMEED